jgi:hypothetical protein
MVGAMLLSDRDPAQAEVNAQGQVINRPMLVPAVGDSLDSWTLPRRAQRSHTAFFEDGDGELLPANLPDRVRPRRMGIFTPISPVNEAQETTAPAASSDMETRRQRERSDHAAEMNSEEMEQHISDVMRSNTGISSPLSSMTQENRTADTSRLEQAADALLRAAQMQMMLGQLRVTGAPNIAGVMGDVVGQVQQERQQNRLPTSTGIDHLQVGNHMARAVGVTPQETGGSAIQRDLARFGLFVDQALRLGLTPQQTEQVVREVQSSPDGKMQPATRELLDKQVQTTQNVSWLKARDEVDTLERSARMLPPEIVAFGAMRVPVESEQPQVNVNVDPTVQVNVSTPSSDDAYDTAMKKEAALGGSGNIMGGGD